MLLGLWCANLICCLKQSMLHQQSKIRFFLLFMSWSPTLYTFKECAISMLKDWINESVIYFICNEDFLKTTSILWFETNKYTDWSAWISWKIVDWYPLGEFGVEPTVTAKENQML